MPTNASMRIPPPRDWVEFQDITTSALRIRWSSPSLTQYGRQGQAQQGVDIFGQDHLGRSTGVQCKCQESLDFAQIKREVASAERFKPNLANYYFALAGPRDARVQQQLRLLSEKRLQGGKFAVGIFFWDDLLEDLTRSPPDFAKHFPSLTPPTGGLVIDADTKVLADYDAAYDGLDVRYSIELIFGEIGHMVQEDPHQIDHLMRVVEASTACLLPKEQHCELVSISRRLVDTAMLAREGKADWATVIGMSGTVEAMVRGVEYAVTGLPLQAFHLGVAMRSWNRIAGLPEDDVVAPDMRAEMLMGCEKLGVHHEIVEALERIIDQFNKRPGMVASGMPHRAYNLVRRGLRARRLSVVELETSG